MIKRLKALAKRAFTSEKTTTAGRVLAEPIIIPRDQHPISRSALSKNAVKVLYRLHNSGYDAYLVGGCVRDLLLGIQPKDFDVVTNATPEQIKRLFGNCRLIGRRFRLAHVVFGKEIIEVATFRGHHDSPDSSDKIAQQNDKGMLLRDNVYGDIEEDAERRDFTVNALYYNIADFAIYDFADGVKDIEAGQLRLIGDAEQRYREDPVRMLRAIRFATKLNMKLTPQVAEPIPRLADLLGHIPPARLFEEFLKLFMAGKAAANFEQLSEFGLFQMLFPMLKQYIKNPDSESFQLIRRSFADTDKRVNNDQRVTPAYLVAVLLWYPLQARQQQLMAEGGLPPVDALNIAAADVVGKQAQSIAIPKRFSMPARDIWHLQQRMERTKGGARVRSVLEHGRFRAAYDFLLLRADIATGDEQQLLQQAAQRWTEWQNQPQSAAKPSNQGRRRSNRRRKPRSQNSSSPARND
ncbi:polynucleotide adenylyltransferase PcnB [Idiomarina tyrosinivorans]|uniref:polynucleotide adenylyltransferase PcnB n=1 Tax=Idiomarina tyrosinivorans TaxID=1445662 RepID=UPI003B847B22